MKYLIKGKYKGMRYRAALTPEEKMWRVEVKPHIKWCEVGYVKKEFLKMGDPNKMVEEFIRFTIDHLEELSGEVR